MSGLVIALISVGSTLVYTIGCGVTYALGKERGWSPNEHFEHFAAIAVWPFLLPGMLAASATRALIEGRKRKALPEAKVVSK